MGKCSEICAVVVTYNRKEKLRKCIECIQNQVGVSCDIFIVNNASTDGTEEMIMTKYDLPGIHYFNTGSNLGGAGGFEIGIKEAVTKGYKYIWIMDDDTWPNPDSLQELVKADKELNGEWGFLSSVAYWTDGSICRMNIQKKGVFKHIGKNEYSKQLAKIKMCSFVSLFVRSEVIKEVGLPIGEYFIWTDDYEFTGRISRKYNCYLVTGSHVIHAMSKHTRVNFAKDDADRIDRYKYIYRNDVNCYRSYGMKGWAYIVSKDLYSIFNIIVHSKDRKLEKIGVILKGFKDGIAFNPTIHYLQ